MHISMILKSKMKLGNAHQSKLRRQTLSIMRSRMGSISHYDMKHSRQCSLPQVIIFNNLTQLAQVGHVQSFLLGTFICSLIKQKNDLKRRNEASTLAKCLCLAKQFSTPKVHVFGLLMMLMYCYGYHLSLCVYPNEDNKYEEHLTL